MYVKLILSACVLVLAALALAAGGYALTLRSSVADLTRTNNLAAYCLYDSATPGSDCMDDALSTLSVAEGN